MLAWELESRGFDTVKLVDRPVPTPGRHEMLVRVSAVSLNHRDEDIVVGNYPFEIPTPVILVSDAAGVVVQVGEDVSRFSVGDRVTAHLWSRWIDGAPTPDDSKYCLGGPLPGALAEYILLHEDGAVASPSTLTDGQAATLPLAALTAWFALVEQGELRAGQSVLVQGTGTVSIFAVQLASAMGARVICTSSSDEKLRRMEALGADTAINYRRVDWADEVRRVTDDTGVDHVIDVVGDLERSVHAARVGGHVAVIGYLASNDATIDLMELIARRVQIRGIGVGHRTALEHMNEFVESNAITPVIDSTYAFHDAHAAFDRRRSGAFGKVVIDVASAFEAG